MLGRIKNLFQLFLPGLELPASRPPEVLHRPPKARRQTAKMCFGGLLLFTCILELSNPVLVRLLLSLLEVVYLG